MAQQKQYAQNSDESLKRSHSKSSNAKLTLLCLLSSLSLNIAVCGISLYTKFLNMIMLICGIACAVVFVLTVLLLNKFTR